MFKMFDFNSGTGQVEKSGKGYIKVDPKELMDFNHGDWVVYLKNSDFEDLLRGIKFIVDIWDYSTHPDAFTKSQKKELTKRLEEQLQCPISNYFDFNELR